MLFEYSSVNGGEQSFLAIADHLRELGHELICAVPFHGSLPRALEARELSTVEWDVHEQPADQSVLRHRLQGLIERVGPDLVHANSLSMARLLGPVAESLELPSIGHVRDIYRLSKRAIADVNCNRRLLFVSKATCRFHVQQGVDPTCAYVVHNGIAINDRAPNPDGSHLGFVGQIGMRKGIDVLLDACAILRPRFPELKLTIIGERFSQKEEAVEYERQLRHRAESSELAGVVTWAGWMDNAALIMNQFSVLVHPARQEPFGRVLLEAAAQEIPIVATDVGGTRELLGARGVLVAADSVEQLASAIEETLRDRHAAQERAAAIRDRVEQLFDPLTVARRVSRHYMGEVDR